ncbi:MAG: O-methyltransferase [Ktedonobacteraceae bacterium]
MLDSGTFQPPVIVRDIDEATHAIGFTMGSDLLTGSLLRTLAATKPGGAILELGTGTGLASAWLLDGMDATARLISVDRDQQTSAVARRFLERDARITFMTMEGSSFIDAMIQQGKTFDLIFADMPPGKFQHLKEALQLLKVGGIYVVDDLLPLVTWEAEHLSRVSRFIDALEQRQDLKITRLNWASGVLIAAKIRP